jgi:hypothetical protein
MGLLDALFGGSNKKQRLLEWQNVVMAQKLNRLAMSEHQLRQASVQQAQNDLRIMNDCEKLLSTTVKPDVFFNRLNLMVEKGQHLQQLEKYISFSGASPTAALNEIKQNYQEAVRQFLVRYFSDTFDKAEAMKTEKGKQNKYIKFYESLQEYYCYMSDSNKEYVETKYHAYVKD